MPAQFSRSAILGGIALATGALLASAPLTAHAAESSHLTCPQARANVGIPITASPALTPNDGGASVAVTTGALPAGIALAGAVRGAPFTFSGTPTTAGTSTFTLTATFEGAPATTLACTVKVGALAAPTRISGTDRYDQAALVSKANFDPATVDLAYVASGEKFPDALSAGSVAGFHDAPLLLTQAEAVPASTQTELSRLTLKNLVVVGGPASISDATVAKLRADNPGVTVTRISGADRYSGSRALIADPTFGIPEAFDIYMAAGGNFPDALAASPAAVGWNAPVLLVDGTKTTPSAEELALLTSLKTETITIAGGVNSVTKALQDSFATHVVEVMRFSGVDRYEGAVEINKDGFTQSETVYLASGELFPDALSAGPAAGISRSPIYLVHKDCVPVSVLDDITDRVKPTKIVILGGTNTVGTDVAALKPC